MENFIIISLWPTWGAVLMIVAHRKVRGEARTRLFWRTVTGLLVYTFTVFLLLKAVEVFG